MSPDTYKAALSQAKQDLADSVGELGELQQKAEEIDKRIMDLRQTVSVLSKLCGEQEVDLEDALGLTDAIRVAMTDVPGNQAVTAQDVRLRLESRGFNTRRYGNLLASIHTVLKRLQTKGEISLATIADGKPAYRWGKAPISVSKAPAPIKPLRG